MPEDLRVTVPGLAETAEILIDRFGVPHITAASTDDVFCAQGWHAARARLWQLDLWRRTGLGLLAEVLGPGLVARDRAARLFLYRGDMAAEWAAYGEGVQRIVTAFVAGVNAWIAETERDPSLLPVEFAALRVRPGRWSPEDVVRIRANGLYTNAAQEAARARTVREFGPEVERLRRVTDPQGDVEVPEGLDLGRLPDDVLAVYRLAFDPPALTGLPSTGEGLEGSNNWVLAGSRTATGRPLLASDPHRALSLPSLRALVHLTAPGLDVIGAGEPALPGISMGHNGRIAFGLTVFPVDQEDLYLYETSRDDARRYRYVDGLEPMRVVNESVPVRGEAPREVELVFTRHGPVLYEDPAGASAVALRAAWLESGAAPYLGGLALMQARDWDGFVQALHHWSAPPENQLYADVTGRIGWRPSGRVPRRPNWTGALPVPGDGRYEWAAAVDPSELPVKVDPARGWLASANEMNLPEGHPSRDLHLGVDWSAPTRAQRIAELLTDAEGVTVADCVTWQHDTLSLPARRLCALLADVDDEEVAGLEHRVQRAHALLVGWDARLDPGSTPAALFEVWYRFHLRSVLLRRALRPLVPAARLDEALRVVLPPDEVRADPRVELDLLERPGSRLGPDPRAAVTEILLESLRAAVDDVSDRLGPDPDRWQWGALHTAHLRHPLVGLLPPGEAQRLEVGPVPRGGSGDTVLNTGYGPDLLQTHGATVRLVIDVGEWDASVAVNAPGESGDPRSPHATDLWQRWARGGTFPLCYTRTAVEAHAEQRITLVPADTGEGGPP